MNSNNLEKNTSINLALSKPTTQSSIYNPEKYGYDPQGACNGKRTGAFGFCTLEENKPWWQIDLQGMYQLSEIKIYNRLDFEERASTLNVLLSQDALNWELCYSNDKNHLFGGIDGHPLIINAHQRVARYVRLQLRESGYLHLDEVEVYGTPVEKKDIESKVNWDEATLAANFYRQSSLPPAPPIMEMVVSQRADGIGTRFMSILSARYLCEYFKCKMCIAWPSIKSRYYSSNILQADSIAEIFENGKVFKDINIDILTEAEFSTLDLELLSDFRKGAKRKGCFLMLNQNETEALSQQKFLNYDEPWAIVPYGIPYKQVVKIVKHYWNRLNWHQSIVNSLRSFEKQVNHRPYAVLHIRRGDIIDRLLYDRIQVLNKDMQQILGRFLPNSTAIQLILEGGFKDVVVCSECERSTQEIVDEVKQKNNSINFYIASKFTQSLSETQAATFDLIVMSGGTQIITSSSSSFSRCAEFSGNASRLRIDTDWENMAHELVGYLEKNDNEMTNERKSLIYIHIGQKIQNKERANYYLNLAKQISSNTFVKFAS